MDIRLNITSVIRNLVPDFLSLQSSKGISGGVVATELNWQIIAREFESHWVPYTSSLVPYLNKTWTLTKRLKKKLDGNYTRMLRAILNKSWRQHHTRHQLYGHLPPITKTIQVRRTKHAGHCWRSRNKLIRDVL